MDEAAPDEVLEPLNKRPRSSFGERASGGGLNQLIKLELLDLSCNQLNGKRELMIIYSGC